MIGPQNFNVNIHYIVECDYVYLLHLNYISCIKYVTLFGFLSVRPCGTMEKHFPKMPAERGRLPPCENEGHYPIRMPIQAFDPRVKGLIVYLHAVNFV